MHLHADFTAPVFLPPSQHIWTPSPQPGVSRVMLDRIGAEVARATSLVRYAPGSVFPPHPHELGEEILVLEGVFSEDGRHHPAGRYLRNPPGSAHQPASEPGTLIFVKLRQMRPDERATVHVDTRDPARWQAVGALAVCPLHEGPDEQVRLLRVPAYAPVPMDTTGGAEWLVLQGELQPEGGPPCPPHAWGRLPPQHRGAVRAGPQGAELYLKTGHLHALAAAGAPEAA